MSIIFATFVNNEGKEQCLRFYNFEDMFEWLSEWHSKVSQYPSQLCVFKGECIFDGS